MPTPIPQAQQAQWAEEDRKNKSLPKKEAEMLEAQIGKDKADFIAKQESEGEQLLNKQADHFEALKLRMQQDNKDMAQRQSAEQAKLASQHEQNLTLLREQNAAEMVSMQERHEKAKVDHVRKQASEQETLQTEKKADADNAGIRNEEFRKDMATRHTKETEQNVLLLDREKKQLDQRQEERRKQHAAELEEELTRFSARQEEERNAFMSKQKANEKKLVESQIAQSDEMESNHAEEKVNAEGRQRGEISDLEAKQHRLQTKLDSRHASQRSALASEQQKAKAQFLLKQQTDRDRHAAKHRDILSRVIEHTQNEVNHALLNKAGFLLTAPPAAGKTCAVSQLMMTALNDKKPGGFVPIAIKVQQLQNRLHADRHEIDRRLKEERDLYYGDEHVGFDLYTLRDLMRRLSNGKKRIKDYFEQWDTDKNGTVDRAEFGEAVRSLGGRNASEDEIQAAFDQLDLDHSGEIDCESIRIKPTTSPFADASCCRTENQFYPPVVSIRLPFR
jgi:Ca2+-binding EF-hand superfamily protein